MRSMRAVRIGLLGAFLTVALATSALAAAVIHFEREGLPALIVQLGKHEVHALTFHPAPAPGHVHVSMNDGRHFTVVYTPSEQARLIAMARADGTRVTVATVKPKAAAKPVHHTLRYIAGGIVVVVIVVVVAVLLVDRRRKLGEQDQGTPAPSSPGDSA
jgi:hypothetical protein